MMCLSDIHWAECIHHSLPQILQSQVKPPMPFKCITSVRISTMFENRDPHVRTGCMHELPSLKSATLPSFITIL